MRKVDTDFLKKAMKLSVYSFPLVLTFRLPMQLPLDLPDYEYFPEKVQQYAEQYPDFDGYNGSVAYDYNYDLYIPYVEVEMAAQKLLELGRQYNIA